MNSSANQYSLFEVVEPLPVSQGTSDSSLKRYSDYIVYVDESGDHSLVSIDAEYPVFVLALCVFHKRHYSEKIIPAVEKLKFNYFGNLSQLSVQNQFMGQLSSIIEASNFILITCVVDKSRLSRATGATSNPYHLALGICLESLRNFLVEKKQDHLQTHVVVECRGKKEDSELELEFRRICDGSNVSNKHLPFEIIFADKKTNLAGLQLADLVARPVGVSYLRPMQENKAFEILKQKFYCAGGRVNVGSDYENLGLTIHPAKKAKSPGEPTEAITPTRNPQSI